MSESDFLAVHPDPVLHYERSPDGIVIRDINPAFETTFQASRTDDGGVSLQETLVTEATITEVADAIHTGDPLDRRVNCPVDDEARPFRLQHVPAEHEGYLIYTDESEQVARQEALVARNEQLETFASVVSHDLRNPIDVAETYLQAARTDGDPEHFKRIEDALSRMRTLIDDVLALARQGQVVDDTERVTLAEIAEDAWAAVDTEDSTLHLREETATLQADPDRLQQLLANLLRNAVEHGSTSPESQARQDSLEHGGPTITVGTIDGDRTGWYLEDDGPGIPADEREDVFEPGVTNSTEGTGLGLAIVSRIAEAHGWDVTVTDGDDGGARFEFTDTDSLQPF
ncbi:MAG: sensor histidine kinase [Halorientalis sp.]